MEKSLLIAGFGGQGVQTLGKLLTYAASDNGLYVTFYPSYGAEMRGGTSNCTVVVSDKEIAAPYRSTVDYVVALNAPSYSTFRASVKDGGTLIVNSNLVENAEACGKANVMPLALNDLAAEMGSPMTLNVIMLGVLSQLLECIDNEIAGNTVRKRLGKRADMLEMNLRAFHKGIELAKV